MDSLRQDAVEARLMAGGGPVGNWWMSFEARQQAKKPGIVPNKGQNGLYLPAVVDKEISL
jgi:hypothetical protein